jgi:hypothetical protein
MVLNLPRQRWMLEVRDGADPTVGRLILGARGVRVMMKD